MEHFRLKTAGGEPVEPVGRSQRLSSHYADVSYRICVVAWQGHRGDKLHLSEDAELMASELNREWPSIEHWAAPATADEIRAHATQAARLMARAA
jgi:hypothetical protein